MGRAYYHVAFRDFDFVYEDITDSSVNVGRDRVNYFIAEDHIELFFQDYYSTILFSEFENWQDYPNVDFFINNYLDQKKAIELLSSPLECGCDKASSDDVMRQLFNPALFNPPDNDKRCC